MLITNEDIENRIKEIETEIAGLPQDDDTPLSKEEKKHRNVLLMKRRVLLNIKSARERNRQDDEFFNRAAYSLLNTWGAKHPFLMHLLLTKFRWNIL